jgi:N-acetylglucosamine malate deacetylase 1
MSPYHELVRRYADARQLPLARGRHAGTPPPPPTAPRPDAPVALIFSPHPDDECIIGALPRRLQQLGWRIINIAVTLGSNIARRAARADELAAACAHLGWANHILGWEHITPAARATTPAQWNDHLEAVRALLTKFAPRLIFCPHAHDGHPAHIGVHHLVHDALADARDGPAPIVVETEYWHPMERPNLMVECPGTDLSELITALACHVGEVARNPYHRSLPAWMIDNVRRGAERVGRGGGAAPPPHPSLAPARAPPRPP